PDAVLRQQPTRTENEPANGLPKTSEPRLTETVGHLPETGVIHACPMTQPPSHLKQARRTIPVPSRSRTLPKRSSTGKRRPVFRRSEERRVGKERRSRWTRYEEKEKGRT